MGKSENAKKCFKKLYLNESLQCEDHRDKSSEDLLREPGDILDKGTGICSSQYEEHESHPKTSPEAEGNVLDIVGAKNMYSDIKKCREQNKD